MQRGGRARPERERTEEEGGTEGRRGREDGREEGEGGMVESRRSTRPRGGGTRRRTHRIWKNKRFSQKKGREGGRGRGKESREGERGTQLNGAPFESFFWEGVSVKMEKIIGPRRRRRRGGKRKKIQPGASCVASWRRLAPFSGTNVYRLPESLFPLGPFISSGHGGGWPPPPWLPSEKSVWTTGSPRPPFLNPLPNPRLHRAPRSRPGGRAGPPRRPRPRFSAVRDKAGLFCLGSLWLSSSPSGPALLRPLRDGAFAPREARRAPGLGRRRRAPGLGRGHPRRAEAEGLLSPWLALAFLRPLRAGFPSPPQGRRLRSARGPPRPWAGQRTPRPWAGQGRTEAGRGGRPRAPAPNAGGRRRGPATHLQRNSRQSLKGKTRLPLLTLA